MLTTTTKHASTTLTRNVLRANKSISSIQNVNLRRRSLIQVAGTREGLIRQGYRSSEIAIVRTISTSQSRLNQSETETKAEPREPTNTDRQGNKEIPPEWWIKALEATANAEWLFHLPNEPVDRLKRAFTLIFQVILYLGRPQDEEVAIQFLNAFSSAVVPPESEIGRARRAVANITRAVVHDISSIPLTSPLRGEQVQLFEVFGALQPLHDVYLENMREGDIDAGEWSEFWKRGEPVLLTLGETLDQKGFGLESDERKAAGMPVEEKKRRDEKKREEEGSSIKEQ